ncbi:choice-of-anchor J domain-containing protein [Thiocapsa sp.]|uniref:choice-of-anchor J domain-containing protein n=1 Tax=Thiocapsa sp. TaxID=2024551 RepID=UPI0035934201
MLSHQSGFERARCQPVQIQAGHLPDIETADRGSAFTEPAIASEAITPQRLGLRAARGLRGWIGVMLCALVLAPPSASAQTLFQEGFESGWGSWFADNGVWEVGTPTAGPAACQAGAQCAGTVLGGNYPAETDSRLISPQISLPSVSGDEKILLGFWHWFSLSSWATETVQLSAYNPDTGQWSAWTQVGSALSAGTSSDWSYRIDDLTPYAGKTVKFAFFHFTQFSYQGAGWFIDEIRIFKETPVLPNPETFEGGRGDWSADRGIWDIGTPPDGTTTCHSGTQCAGTMLTGNSTSRLMTPPVRLLDESGISLSFWHWFSTSGAQVQISTYDEATLTWSAWQNLGTRISGTSTVWSFRRDDLSPYAGKMVRIAFYHDSTSRPGWYIDDIEIDTVTGPNQPPEARISGAPFTVQPGALVALGGSASSDPDGQIASYAWSTTGPCGIVGAANEVDASVQIAADAAPGSQCAVTLEVTDNLGASDIAQAVMIVGDPEDDPPESLLIGQPNATATLNLLDGVRDRVLRQLPEGDWLVSTYYRHSSEVVDRLSRDPRLQAHALYLLARLGPTFVAAVDADGAEGIALRPSDRNSVRRFAEALQNGASPALATDLERFLTQWLAP